MTTIHHLNCGPGSRAEEGHGRVPLLIAGGQIRFWLWSIPESACWMCGVPQSGSDGGLADFPNARAYTASEERAAIISGDWRYHPAQFGMVGITMGQYDLKHVRRSMAQPFDLSYSCICFLKPETGARKISSPVSNGTSICSWISFNNSVRSKAPYPPAMLDCASPAPCQPDP